MKMHKKVLKNTKNTYLYGKKTVKIAFIGKKSLKKMILIIRVVIKKFTKKMKKSLVE